MGLVGEQSGVLLDDVGEGMAFEEVLGGEAIGGDMGAGEEAGFLKSRQSLRAKSLLADYSMRMASPVGQNMGTREESNSALQGACAQSMDMGDEQINLLFLHQEAGIGENAPGRRLGRRGRAGNARNCG